MDLSNMKYATLINCRTEEEVQKAVLEWTSNKSEKEHLIRSAILEIHALVEDNLKFILFEFLVPSVSIVESKKIFKKRKDILSNMVTKLSFQQVFRLLKPGLDAFDNPNLKPIDDLNKVRNLAVHQDINKVIYKNRNPFKDFDCLAQIFFDGWAVC